MLHNQRLENGEVSNENQTLKKKKKRTGYYNKANIKYRTVRTSHAQRKESLKGIDKNAKRE
jgi:hypothetical protein